jgi:hypothetical protein
MSYTTNLEKDFLCNYINPNITSADKMLLSCINSPELSSSKNNCNNSSVNIPIIEGFTSGPGAYHIKKGECPDGHSMINGECYQVCRGCNYNDKSGYFGDSSKFPFGENTRYNGSCGKGYRLLGTDSDGYIKCEKKKDDINTLDDDFNIAPFF